MQSKYKEKAIPLISVDPTSGKYVLTPEANEFIRSIPGPIGVVSVAGLYRTGKSYLLNQMLLNRSNGFGVGPTINPCTKGLWCWGTPIKGESADGQKLNIIVIDTEGIGALDEDQTHDTKIFTLAILASSCFIYNSVGSIDQTALQSLSLVVNLTKHIQLRSQKSIDDQDPERISNYFPKFYWVVRDFSLQISDPNGNKMSSKQYLERALAPQKGYSEDIEQKNRIRKMLTSFFKERQCFTLFRPLIDETKLQDLDKMSFDDLRPDFINQVINFRKDVVTRMKPKVLNGQKLSGELYVSMLNSYVGAINEGAVPNIENAWNYMCQQQCTKVMSESLEAFEAEIRQIRIPCSAEDMNKAIESAQEVALQKFKKKSIGDDAEKYYKQIRNKMKARAIEIRKINAEDGKAAFKKYITPSVGLIQKKIQDNQFTSFEEFLEELKKVEEKITKEGPNYVDSNLNCQLCINKILGQGVTYLSKRMKLDKEQMKKTLEQKVKINQNEVDSLKRQRDNEQNNMRQKLTQLDKEKLDLMFKVEKLTFQLQRTTEQKSKEEEHLTKNLTAKKNEIEQIRRQFQIKVTEACSQAEKKGKILHEQKSSWEKERAILQLKVKQQSERIEELQTKMKSSSAKLLMDTAELSQKHREESLKLQNQIQQLMKNLNESRERNQKLQQTQNQMKVKYENLTQKFETTERKLRQETNSRARDIQRMRNEHEGELTRVKNQMMQNVDDSEKIGREMGERMKKQDTKIRELNDELKTVKNRYERQNQVLNQELQFAKRSLDEARQKIVDTKAAYENKIAAIEADSGLQREQQVQRKIAEMKSSHEDQIRSLEVQAKENQKNLTMQIENLTKLKNELEYQLRVLGEQLNNEKIQNDQIKRNMNEINKQLENEMRAVQRQKVSELIAKEGYFNSKIAQLETDLEQARENYHSQKAEAESRATSQIMQIKNYYLMQREKQQSTSNQQKEKMKKKYNEMIMSLQKKLEEETANHEEERQRLQSQYQNQIEAGKITISQLTHEKDNLSKEKANLDRDLTRLQDRYTKMETQLNDRLQKLTESSKTEKDNLTKKLEELQFSKNQMQKQILSLTHERDQFRNQSQKQSAEIGELKFSNTSLTQRFESMKTSFEERLKQLQDRYLREKSKSETELALLQQKKNFSEQKIGEMEKQLKQIKESEQQKMRIMKEKYDEEKSLAGAKFETEMNSFKQKFDKFKKQSSETESSLMKKLTQLSKENTINEQKIEFLNKMVAEIQLKSANQVSSREEQLKALRQKFSTESSQLKLKIGELQDLLQSKESELADLKNSSDVQNALDKNKIQNLLERIQNLQAQKAEASNDLNKRLEQARKRNQNDKNNQHLTHQEYLTKIQSKYRNQVSQLRQDNSKKTQQIEFLNKEHVRTIKELNEKLGLQRQNKTSVETKLVRIQTEFIQKQARMMADIDKLKTQKEQLSMQSQKQIDREKQTAKMKIADMERRMNEFEKLKTSYLFEKQKQEAKWSMERTAYAGKVEQLKEQIEKQREVNQKTIKQIEKLKAEKKKNTSFIKQNQTTIMAREISSENKENAQIQ